MWPVNSPTLATPLRSSRILCVDDSTALGVQLVQLFSNAGYAVEYVSDGLQAWDRISQDIGYFDIVVTDHKMPGLNGLELVEVLRAGNYRGRIVVHSGYVTADDLAKYRALGVDAVVVKGGDRELLPTVAALPPPVPW